MPVTRKPANSMGKLVESSISNTPDIYSNML